MGDPESILQTNYYSRRCGKRIGGFRSGGWGEKEGLKVFLFWVFFSFLKMTEKREDAGLSADAKKDLRGRMQPAGYVLDRHVLY